jgi:hypothetical protein
MSLLKNVANQNFTFALINPATDAAMTGATITGFVSKDGGAQASIAGSVSELGNGVYNYVPTQAETNANCVSFMMSGSTSSGTAVPENLMFLTGGLHRATSGQHITFGLFTTAGVADPSATVTVKTSKDGSAQAAGAGTVTNLGNGQYDYAPTQAETAGSNVSFLFTASGDVPVNISIFTVP